MLAVAGRDVDETWLANWLRERTTFSSEPGAAAR